MHSAFIASQSCHEPGESEYRTIVVPRMASADVWTYVAELVQVGKVRHRSSKYTKARTFSGAGLGRRAGGIQRLNLEPDLQTPLAVNRLYGFRTFRNISDVRQPAVA